MLSCSALQCLLGAQVTASSCKYVMLLYVQRALPKAVFVLCCQIAERCALLLHTCKAKLRGVDGCSSAFQAEACILVLIDTSCIDTRHNVVTWVSKGHFLTHASPCKIDVAQNDEIERHRYSHHTDMCYLQTLEST